MALDFLAGCVGGCAGVIVGHPLDTVKVRLQTQDYRNPIYKGTWHCFSSIAKKESISGLYKGVTSPLGGVAIVNAIVFGVYGNVQRYVGSESLSSHFLAGSLAGVSQSLISSPIELAKTRLQVQSSQIYKGAFDCLSKVYMSEGYRGVYRGLGLCVMREIPGFGFYFLTYELMTGGQDVPTWKMLLAGGTAGSVSWLVAYPIDVLKTRMQSDGFEGPPKYKNAIHCFKQGLSLEGSKFMWRGVTSTLIRAFPTNAVTFTVVSWIMRLGDHMQSKTKVKETRQRENESPFNVVKTIYNQSVHVFEEGSITM